MKAFRCQSCDHPLYFEDRDCSCCGKALVYLPTRVALVPAEIDAERRSWQAHISGQQERGRLCANAVHGVCNWAIEPEADEDEPFCTVCRFNRTIPNLTVPGNLDRWRKLEIAKHRLFYALIQLGLPFHTRRMNPDHGLAFDFLEDIPAQSKQILTGHVNGLITIAIREADDDQRERMRIDMGEHYRTLLGHFRHEIGHYYWAFLISGTAWLQPCRDMFGDERRDYQEALRNHYASGPPPDWREHFISAYASAHPWEDFAETWAHYLHIVSTLETAWAYGVTISRPAKQAEFAPAGTLLTSPFRDATLDDLLTAWGPLTWAVNNLNRSMGQPDLYPFMLTRGVVRKLEFVHGLIRDTQTRATAEGCIANRNIA